MENLALRQQLAILKRERRPRLNDRDRLFWIWLSRAWKDWAEALIIVRPETVIRWHRRGFKWYWTKKSKRQRPGRPKIDPEVRALIIRMAEANPTWGAPRIHGELLKLGIEVSQRTVGRLIPRHRKPPSQTWRTFLDNHIEDLVSIDFFGVPTATFLQIVQAFPWETAPRYMIRDRDSIYGARFRDRIHNMGIEEVLITPRSPRQTPYVEGMISSIRRECLDHVVVLGEAHLRRILSSYFAYHHKSRTHLSLEKDAPVPRDVHPPEMGEVIELPQVGGLHHRYEHLQGQTSSADRQPSPSCRVLRPV